MSSCTVETSAGKFCDRDGAEWAPFPICARHALALFRAMDATFKAHADDPLFRLAVGAEAIEEIRGLSANRMPPSLDTPDPDPIIYFAIIDGLVKIGTTTNLVRRMSQYPPTAYVVATEPGGRDRERELHLQFTEYLTAGREWFEPGPKLRAYVDGLQAKAPQGQHV